MALAAGQISEIKPIAGVDLVGPLPEEIQVKTVYGAALASRSAAPAAARRLLELLSSPEMEPIFRANGFDPP